ncbi:MAG TPA: glycosyltransferase [Longimicrobiales bacterium]
MKVVHLNTHSYGGAAVVARRLHRAGLASGIASSFITKYGLRSDATPGYQALRDARLRYFLREKSADARLYRLGKLVQQLAQHRNLANRPAGLEVFSPLNRAARFADCVAAIDPDVVHLHWVNGFVDHEEFFRLNRSRKFVWTLHDMNPLTGGCHHADGCMKFSADCRACPQLAGTIDVDYASTVLSAKARALSGLRDDQLTIVAPSRWILELSIESRVTRRFRHVLVENPAMEARAPADPAGERRALGLPLDRKVVLFVSDNLRNVRKGVALLFEAARMLPDSIQLIGIGQRTDAPDGVPMRLVGRVPEATMQRYLSCADALVSASVAENSPLVAIEALACGTPVVSFDVGGVRELVGGDSGVLAETRSAAALARAIEAALFTTSFSRDAIREQAKRFAPDVVMQKYRNVYAELLAS